MIIDAHVYCLPKRLCLTNVSLPQSEQLIIDAIYTHKESEPTLKLAKIEEIKSSMNLAQIDKSVLVSFPWKSLELCSENNDHILEIINNSSQFYGICSINPNKKGWIKEAEKCTQAGAIGLKINPEWQNYSLFSGPTNDLAKFAEKNNIFIMTHIDHAFTESKANTAAFTKLISNHPNTKFLAAHLGGLLGIYFLHSPIKKILKNVWFDTAVSSTLKMVEYYADVGLENKVIFGSDFPFNHSHSQKQVVDGIKELQLGDEINKKIFSENFLNLIRQ